MGRNCIIGYGINPSGRSIFGGERLGSSRLVFAMAEETEDALCSRLMKALWLAIAERFRIGVGLGSGVLTTSGGGDFVGIVERRNRERSMTPARITPIAADQIKSGLRFDISSGGTWDSGTGKVGVLDEGLVG